MNDVPSRRHKAGRLILIGLGVTITAGAAAWAALNLPARAAGRPPQTAAESPPPDRFQRTGRDTLTGSAEAARCVGLKTAVVGAATRPRTLAPFPGTLALDSNRLARVHSRFPGEVVAVATTNGTDKVPSLAGGGRYLQAGDAVRRGDLLAVVWSKDLGEKKSELVDAVSKLRARRGGAPLPAHGRGERGHVGPEPPRGRAERRGRPHRRRPRRADAAGLAADGGRGRRRPRRGGRGRQAQGAPVRPGRLGPRRGPRPAGRRHPREERGRRRHRGHDRRPVQDRRPDPARRLGPRLRGGPVAAAAA